MLIVQLVCISMLLSSLDRSAAFSFTAGVCSLARVASVHETALRVQLPDQAERDRAMDNLLVGIAVREAGGGDASEGREDSTVDLVDRRTDGIDTKYDLQMFWSSTPKAVFYKFNCASISGAAWVHGAARWQ